MHNVCTADIARRRGVGRALVSAARAQATKLGVQMCLVHPWLWLWSCLVQNQCVGIVANCSSENYGFEFFLLHVT